jgi:NAD(P)-dependent dehydrogenase (short-subunit alcohol dehydrogenase family)
MLEGKNGRTSKDETARGSRPLEGRVAVVAGATRGAGRGIARGLGEAGATVYCTGRSRRGSPSPYGRRETLEETAEMVHALGGVGIPVPVDHTVEAEVRRLFARVKREHGRLDVLVNSVAGEDPAFKPRSLAKLDPEQGVALMRQAVFSHLRTTQHAAPLLKRGRNPLVVEVTEGDTFIGGFSVLHHLAKVSLKHLANVLAEELRKDEIAVLAVTPGFLRSEAMLDHFKVTPGTWREGGQKDPHFLESETPLFLGRGVAALASDPDVFRHSGDLTSSWELGARYGLADEDGRRPDWGTYFAKIMPTLGPFGEGFAREAAWLERIAARSKRYAGPTADRASD